MDDSDAGSLNSKITKLLIFLLNEPIFYVNNTIHTIVEPSLLEFCHTVFVKVLSTEMNVECVKIFTRQHKDFSGSFQVHLATESLGLLQVHQATG